MCVQFGLFVVVVVSVTVPHLNKLQKKLWWMFHGLIGLKRDFGDVVACRGKLCHEVKQVD